MLATVPDRLPDEQVDRFKRDGFLILEEGFLSDRAIEVLRERFDRLFEGEYATGIQPDEVNWKRGRDPEDLTRQICNGWRADDLIAAQVLSERTGRVAAQLMGYSGDAHAAGQLPLEAARSPVARDAPGRLVRRLPGARGDDHLLGGPRRHARRGRHDRVRPRLAPLAQGAARTGAASTRPRTGSRRCTRPRRRGSSPSSSRWW